MTDDSATGGDVYRGERLCASEEATRDLAARLGALLRGGEILSLVGDLGAGKTTFVRGLAHGLGCENVRLVSSPTYVLEHIYPARHEIHHYDAYRLSCAEELAQLGFDEHIGTDAILVVEWGDRVTDVLGSEQLVVEFGFSASGSAGSVRESAPTSRRITLAGLAGVWQPILAGL